MSEKELELDKKIENAIDDKIDKIAIDSPDMDYEFTVIKNKLDEILDRMNELEIVKDDVNEIKRDVSCIGMDIRELKNKK